MKEYAIERMFRDAKNHSNPWREQSGSESLDCKKNHFAGT